MPIPMRTSNVFFTLFLSGFLSIALIGCTTSEANDDDAIMSDLLEQMESAEQQVADAVADIRLNAGERSEEILKRIEQAKSELVRAQRKLEELRRKHRESVGSESGNERIRIRMNASRHQEDGEARYRDNDDDHRSDKYHHGEAGDEDGDYEYNYEYDYDEDGFDIDINFNDADLKKAFEGIGRTLEKLGEAFNNSEDVRAVDTDDLRSLFPRRVAGMERSNMNSSSNGAFGLRITQTEAEYRGQRTDLSLTVIDLGSLGGVAREGLDMMKAEIDRESNDEYVRTTTIQGYQAKIHFERGRRNDELNVVVMVADRFIFLLEAEGTDLNEDLIDDVLNDFSLEHLEGLDR